MLRKSARATTRHPAGTMKSSFVIDPCSVLDSGTEWETPLRPGTVQNRGASWFPIRPSKLYLHTSPRLSSTFLCSPNGRWMPGPVHAQCCAGFHDHWGRNSPPKPTSRPPPSHRLPTSRGACRTPLPGLRGATPEQTPPGGDRTIKDKGEKSFFCFFSA